MKKIISSIIVISSIILFFGKPVKASEMDDVKIYTEDEIQKIISEDSNNDDFDFSEYENSTKKDFKKLNIKLGTVTICVGSKYTLIVPSEGSKAKIKNKKIVKVSTKNKGKKFIFTGKKVGKTKITVQTEYVNYTFYIKVKEKPKPKRKVVFS